MTKCFMVVWYNYTQTAGKDFTHNCLKAKQKIIKDKLGWDVDFSDGISNVAFFKGNDITERKIIFNLKEEILKECLPQALPIYVNKINDDRPSLEKLYL